MLSFSQAFEVQIFTGVAEQGWISWGLPSYPHLPPGLLPDAAPVWWGGWVAVLILVFETSQILQLHQIYFSLCLRKLINAFASQSSPERLLEQPSSS